MDPIASRQQLAMSADAMAQLCRTGANFQMAQQELVQQMARLYDEAAENLRSAQDYNEIARIQSGLLGSCTQAAMECARECLLAGTQLGRESLRPAPQPEPSTTPSAAEAAMNAMAPAMQAWQQFLAMAANGGVSPRH